MNEFSLELLATDDGVAFDDEHSVTIYVEHCEEFARLTLDNHQHYQDLAKRPDIFIERRDDKWFIAINPDSGDPLVYIEFRDDGSHLVEYPAEAGEEDERFKK